MCLENEWGRVLIKVPIAWEFVKNINPSMEGTPGPLGQELCESNKLCKLILMLKFEDHWSTNKQLAGSVESAILNMSAKHFGKRNSK